MEAEIQISVDPELEGRLRAGIVFAEGLRVRRSGEPGQVLAELLERVRAKGEAWLPPGRKQAVRDLLRYGGYKPAGRAKPSSEYLVAAALEGDFPLVNGPVDANNAASLAYGYPASVFDGSKIGNSLLVKRAGPGDSYVFNPSGQRIELEDLLCVWRRSGEGWEAVGNPVKDAMETKVFEGCSSVVGVVYAPRGPEGAELEACLELYARILREVCGAERVSTRVS